jgi:hypothetical protein
MQENIFMTGWSYKKGFGLRNGSAFINILEKETKQGYTLSIYLAGSGDSYMSDDFRIKEMSTSFYMIGNDFSSDIFHHLNSKAETEMDMKQLEAFSRTFWKETEDLESIDYQPRGWFKKKTTYNNNGTRMIKEKVREDLVRITKEAVRNIKGQAA